MIRISLSMLFLGSLIVVAGSGCASLRSEKRIEHPIRTDYSVTEPEFASAMSHLLGAPLVEGNHVVELLNGDQIFPAMLKAIREARQTVTLEQFIWSSGQVSTQFVAALTERARAGVKVHILVDALGSARFGPADREQLAKAGAEVAIYNPPMPYKILRINHRTHRKIMVVDGSIGFTGGVCMSDDWLGNAEPPRWRDTHFRVEGPVVGQLQGAFMDNWMQIRSEILHGEGCFPDLKPAGSMRAQFYKSGPRDAAENARLAYLLSIAAARKTIKLAHSYFVPDGLLREALMDAHRRGVKIEVIVPSKIDHFAVKKAARSRWRGLLEAGIEFYEYQPTLYHCKIMIVDDIWVTAGSVNFDERSFRINDEANLNVLDREFAAVLTRSFEADKAKSNRLTFEEFRGRSAFSKFMDHFFGLFRAQL